MSLDYIIHCDNWAQIRRGNAGRKTIHGLRAAIQEAKRTLAQGRDDVCRVFLPKNDWLKPGEEVASVHRTKVGFLVNLNPKAGVQFRRVA